MPLYEYKCERCGNTVEKLQKISDEPLQMNCSKGCVGSKVERQISRTSFALKGRGWYRDAYSKPSR